MSNDQDQAQAPAPARDSRGLELTWGLVGLAAAALLAWMSYDLIRGGGQDPGQPDE